MNADTLSGRELSNAVAVECFGWKHGVIFGAGCLVDPQGNPEYAGFADPDCRGLPAILAWLRERGWTYCVRQISDWDGKGDVECELTFQHGGQFRKVEATGDTLPIAVARACIKTAEASR